MRWSSYVLLAGVAVWYTRPAAPERPREIIVDAVPIAQLREEAREKEAQLRAMLAEQPADSDLSPTIQRYLAKEEQYFGELDSFDRR